MQFLQGWGHTIEQRCGLLQQCVGSGGVSQRLCVEHAGELEWNPDVSLIVGHQAPVALYDRCHDLRSLSDLALAGEGDRKPHGSVREVTLVPEGIGSDVLAALECNALLVLTVAESSKVAARMAGHIGQVEEGEVALVRLEPLRGGGSLQALHALQGNATGGLEIVALIGEFRARDLFLRLYEQHCEGSGGLLVSK